MDSSYGQSQMDRSRDERHTFWATIAAVVAAVVGLGLTLALSPHRAHAQTVVETGAYLIRNGNDTLVIERFRRAQTGIMSSVTAKGAPRVDYTVALGANNSVRTLTLDVYAANASFDDKAMQHIVTTMKGDSALVELPNGTQRIATKTNAVPSMNNAMALFELFTRRARANRNWTTSVDEPYFSLSGGATVLVTMTRVGNDSIVATIANQAQRLRVDAEGRILGGTLPGGLTLERITAEAAASLKVGKPDYSAPKDAPYTAEEVTVKGQGGITLGGTLTLPKNAKGPVGAIVTITGSGQQDRDEYIPVAGGFRPFRQVADALGRRGIAVLRLDDRTVGASGGQIGTTADYAEDIKAALAYLRTRQEIDRKRLGLVGHSEGGIIAPLVASTEPTLAGMVLLAGPAYNGLDIIRFQQRFALDHDTSLSQPKRDSLAKVSIAAVDSIAKSDVWFRFFLSYDPLSTARKVKVPALVLQGQSDQQVTYEQAEKLGTAMRAGGNKDVTVRVFPELNHLFIHHVSGNPSEYATLPTNKVSVEVMSMLTEWLVKQLGGTAAAP